jgi:Protein of unknown function (DUF2442)
MGAEVRPDKEGKCHGFVIFACDAKVTVYWENSSPIDGPRLPPMLTKVTRLEKLGGFRLRVRFNDGREGVHDFAAMVQEPGSALEPLRDEEYFARVFLEFWCADLAERLRHRAGMAAPRDESSRRAFAGRGGVGEAEAQGVFRLG